MHHVACTAPTHIDACQRGIKPDDTGCISVAPTYEDTDAYTAEVESIQKLVDLWKLGQPVLTCQRCTKLRHTLGHDGHHIGVPERYMWKGMDK